METNIEKHDRDGWQAVTAIEIGRVLPAGGEGEGHRILKIETGKDYRGGVSSDARVVVKRGSFETYGLGVGGIGGDFRERVAAKACRATEKAVRETHAEALLRIEEVILRAKAHYPATA